MLKITVRRVGNSLGVILPAEARSALNIGEGDVVFLTESPDGFRITPFDPSFEEQIEAAQVGMRQYRNALRELAR
ncbi:MAG: AbrB/MazE/SpoVT family DNA-binding domain-containing protein [Phycisphaerae bacterium]|nr:AbrB/MazE/SpoVT family DNA-binding domain-containing protein [Phycisphaerae bacterium]